MRRVMCFAAIILPIAAGLVAASPPAFACYGDVLGDHCYTEAVMQHPAYNYEGGQATITPHCLYQTDPVPLESFMTQELWVFTDNTIVDPGGPQWYWVESGAMDDGSDPGLQYRWFWANYYPGASQIYVHYNGPSVSMDTDYTTQILYVGSNEWDVFVEVNGGGFTQYGTAYYNPPYSVEMHAGTEYTLQENQAQGRDVGKATSLQYQRTDDTWGDWWGTYPKLHGTYQYVTATLPSDTEIDWQSNNC